MYRRAVGYCMNLSNPSFVVGPGCQEYGKGVFLLNHSDTPYSCSVCRRPGFMEPERGYRTGDSEVLKEVRVEYNFDPINRVYREIAIVRDENLLGSCSTYTLHSPLVKTETRALRVAESLLANLQRYHNPEGIFIRGDQALPVGTAETEIDFDWPIEKLREKLKALGQQWLETSETIRRHQVSGK